MLIGQQIGKVFFYHFSLTHFGTISHISISFGIILTLAQFEVKKFYNKKCINLRQNCLATKLANQHILTYISKSVSINFALSVNSV